MRIVGPSESTRERDKYPGSHEQEARNAVTCIRVSKPTEHETQELSGRWEIPVPLEKDDIKLIEDKLALIESNIRAIREYLDERTMEIQELSDDIMKTVRKG